MIYCIWIYAAKNDQFYVRPASSLEIMVARFVASMMMHIHVEKDVRLGINMMKYCVNHYKNFNNVYPAFFIALFSTVIALIVEINVMIILSSLPNILDVVMKYVSLASIGNIPRLYFGSLVEHEICKVKDLKLEITEYRHMNPRKGAPCCVKVMRGIHKVFRMAFCAASFYFMPFMTIFLNFQFMINTKTDF